MDSGNLFGDIDMEDLIPIIAMAAVQGAPKHSNTPTRSGDGVLSGSDYLDELLKCNNEKRIYGVLRMRKETFLQLCMLLRKKGLLKDSRNVMIEQQVVQFLWIINYSASFEATGERFRLSLEPISRYIYLSIYRIIY